MKKLCNHCHLKYCTWLKDLTHKYHFVGECELCGRKQTYLTKCYMYDLRPELAHLEAMGNFNWWPA